VNQKQCTSCDVYKPLDDFGVEKRVNDGRRSVCRDCKRIADRVRMAAKREDPDFRDRENERAAMRRGLSKRSRRVTFTKRRAACYVWTDVEGNPVYVGVTTLDIASRSAEHMRSTEWAQFCIAPSRPVRAFRTWSQALAFEEGMIKGLAAGGVELFNRTHNERNSEQQYKELLGRVKKSHSAVTSVL
jgi:hypothetical protein